MTSAVGWALFAAVQPVGVVAYIIILTRGGRRASWGFVVGWVLCACAVAVLTVTVAGSTQHDDSSQVIGSAGGAQVVLGLAALVLLAARRIHRGRPAPPAPERAPTPDRETRAGPVGAAVVAILAQGWPVIAAATAGVLSATDAVLAQRLGIVLVVALSSSTYLAAQVISGRYPATTEARLQALRRRIEADRDTLVDVVLLVAGLWLLTNGVVALLAT